MNFYKNILLVENPDDILVLVNKNHQLYQKFIPNDLVVIDSKYSTGKKLVKKEVKDNFEKLSQDAKTFATLNIKKNYMKITKKNMELNMPITVQQDLDIQNIKQV